MVFQLLLEGGDAEALGLQKVVEVDAVVAVAEALGKVYFHFFIILKNIKLKKKI